MATFRPLHILHNTGDYLVVEWQADQGDPIRWAIHRAGTKERIDTRLYTTCTQAIDEAHRLQAEADLQDGQATVREAGCT